MKNLLWAALAFAVLSFPAAAADKAGVTPPIPPVFDESPSPMTVWSGFYVEGGFGLNISNLEVGEVGEGSLATLGDSSWAGHLGVGYDKMISPNVLIGALARVEFNDVAHSIGGEDIGESDIGYMIGVRLGWVPQQDAMLYALLGYKWSDLDLNPELGGDLGREGWVVGGGLELMLTDNWGIGAEYAATLFDSDSVDGVSLEETDHAAKLRLLYKF